MRHTWHLHWLTQIHWHWLTHIQRIWVSQCKWDTCDMTSYIWPDSFICVAHGTWLYVPSACVCVGESCHIREWVNVYICLQCIYIDSLIYNVYTVTHSYTLTHWKTKDTTTVSQQIRICTKFLWVCIADTSPYNEIHVTWHSPVYIYIDVYIDSFTFTLTSTLTRLHLHWHLHWLVCIYIDIYIDSFTFTAFSVWKVF
jgi:hypothetical protein